MAIHQFFLLVAAGSVELCTRMMHDTLYTPGDVVVTGGKKYTVVRVEHYIDLSQTKIFVQPAEDL